MAQYDKDKYTKQLQLPQINEFEEETNIERRHWGEFASDEDESEEESEEGDEEIQPMPPPHESGFVTPATTEGYSLTSFINFIRRLISIVNLSPI